MSKRLEDSIKKLAAAADEFEQACTEVYSAYRASAPNALYTGKAQIYLQDDVQALVANKQYSVVQARAINSAFSGWRPPKPAPVRSFPVTGRSGGAA
ncbi:hypothetical protein [Synechocystis sp. LKSZ1]|uniref:hypothetical protein n=1 Tax=Synechocystis sp. LKSZ1 TaxID=3144951 RepID=UPI00336BAFEB